MIVPWDFGLINSLKNLLNISIFPSEPPEENRKKPYIILELKNIIQNVNLQTKIDFKLTVVNGEDNSVDCYSLIKTFKKITAEKLSLHQGNFKIGNAQIKLQKFETKKNNLILELTALLQLKAIYEDTEEILDD